MDPNNLFLLLLRDLPRTYIAFCSRPLSWNIVSFYWNSLNRPPLRSLFLFFSFFSIFFGCAAQASRILVLQSQIEPVAPAVEVWSLNHWTTREAPAAFFLNTTMSASICLLDALTFKSIFLCQTIWLTLNLPAHQGISCQFFPVATAAYHIQEARNLYIHTYPQALYYQ